MTVVARIDRRRDVSVTMLKKMSQHTPDLNAGGVPEVTLRHADRHQEAIDEGEQTGCDESKAKPSGKQS